MSSFRALAESLDRCVDPNDPEVNYLLRSLATYAMVQALYFSTGKFDFELIDRYCTKTRDLHYC